MAYPLQSAASETVGAVTLAVSTTGNDNDTTRPKRIVRGDWTAKPFATIQGALDSLSKVSGLRSAVFGIEITINVAAGTYPGFLVSGINANININGVRSAFAPTTGPATGTFTAGTGGRVLTLTGAGWTANNLVGAMLVVTSGPGAGQVIPIFSNTTDQIVLAGRSIPAIGAGSVFTLEQPAVEINTPYPGGSGTIYRIYLANSRTVRLANLKTTGGSGFVANHCTGTVDLTNCVVYSPSSTYGFWCAHCRYFSVSRCAAIGSVGSGLGVGAQCVGFVYITQSMVVGFTAVGGFVLSSGVDWAYVGSGISAQNCKYGVQVIGGGGDLFVEEPLIDACQTGIALKRASVEIQDPEINNSTTTTFDMTQSVAELNGQIKGVGNVGFGLDAKGVGNTVRILSSSVATITGAAGDVTIDGTTPIPWSALASVGNYAVDVATGARIVRQ